MQNPDASRLVPVLVADRVTDRADGGLEIARKRLGPLRRMVLRAFGQPVEVVVRLDAMGSAAVRLVDGKRNLGAIRDALQAQFPRERDVAVRLGRLVSELVERRLVTWD